MSKRIIILLIPFLFFFFENKAFAKEKEERQWQDENMYLIMVDRFNDGNHNNLPDVNKNDPTAYQGGDLAGITQKLDYIKKLGMTAIWLTPIVENEEKGYHGYWAKDFYKVDEHFGSMQDLKKLVAEAHKRKIKVILDLVVNHTGYNSPWLQDPTKKNWFHPKKDIENWDDQNEVENGWLAGLPDLNQNNPAVKQYLINMAVYWIKETNIDGYRLDTVKHVPKSFWTDFTKAVKKAKPGFFLIGEVWHNDPRYIASYQKTGIQSLLDYPFYNEVTAAFSQSGEPLSELYSVWQRNQTYYQQPEQLGNFIDNHDNIRFVRQALIHHEDPEKRLKMALMYLYTAPGIPILYQGTEDAMDGADDPDNRRMMAFGSNPSMEHYVSFLANARQQHSALRRGDYRLVLDQGNVAVFSREDKNEQLYMIYNNTKKAKTVSFQDLKLPDEGILQSLQNSQSVFSIVHHSANINMNAETAIIVKAEKQKNTWTNYLWFFIAVFLLVSLYAVYQVKKNKAKKLRD